MFVGKKNITALQVELVLTKGPYLNDVYTEGGGGGVKERQM